MIKSKSRLAIKLFIIVWIVLAVHIALKLTFNYWQPYVIPNETIGAISNYIDTHRWLQFTLNGLLYTFNGIIMVLTALQRWWFKNKKQSILIIGLIVINFPITVINPNITIGTFLIVIIIPLILNYKQWLYIILSFLLNNVFLLLSLWLEGFVKTNDMQYIIQTFFVFDYYIMLVLCYFVFNLIKKGRKNNG